MSNSANPEQLRAIEHQGGVLLKAGAGSGKTFVLVQHILYLTKGWIEEYKQKNQGNFEDFLRAKFSQVVMMTFTKKAAGEMSIRLADNFIEMTQIEGENQKYWILANEILPSLLVTTIDGFCRKLITLGYFPHLSTEARVIFATERMNQVREIVEDWFSERSSQFSSDMLDIVIKEKKSLLNSFYHIFSDPGLRIAWKKFDQSEIAPDFIPKTLSRSFTLNNLEESLLAIGNLDLDEESGRSAFEKIVAQFQATGLPRVENWKTLKLYSDEFSKLKRLDGERSAAKKTPTSVAAKQGLSDLRDWVRIWDTEITDYEKNFESKIKPWMNLCLDIFNFIEEKLDPNQGMTFGDIEYFVALGLEETYDRERIQKSYNYFIVDEFQDTSSIQFKIIKSLIESDFTKLFCVGDAKQAIYGFRGGELSVFNDCNELMPLVLSLENNYRSHKEVIHFNNSLFKTILPIGQNFEGHDPFSVAPEDQTIPPDVEKNEKGCIGVLSCQVNWEKDVDEKLRSEDLNKLEAEIIADSILKERKNSDQVCTVLYSKLRPSSDLIRALMDRKIGFTAQFKIDLLDDPVLGLFILLMKRKFDKNPETKDQFPLYMIRGYLSILKLNVTVSENDFNQFELDLEYWGLVSAFRKFLFKLNITNENSDINLESIELISSLFHQDTESVLTQLLYSDNDPLKMDLRYGKDSHLVQIMSAHASKGLEFDVVYLGGIYTNGREQNDGALFGDYPGSFQWFVDLGQREKRKSPMYLLEKELDRYKSFSEAKRLFYVATTRAKKKLFWVDFQLPEKSFSIPKNSWILGIRAWLDKESSKDQLKKIEINNFDSRNLLSNQSAPQLPLFFYDPVGLYDKGHSESELMVAAELSVTRLNSLIDCPRKFYFSNILKISGESSEVSVTKFEEVEEADDNFTNLVKSSAGRGTYIHEQIAEGINNNFIVPRRSFGTDFEQPIRWALDLLKDKVNDYDFDAEKPLKFKFFNFMISGTPDLIIQPKENGTFQIWDFKTGKITQENLQHYWLQLSIYAYGMYDLGKVDQNSQVEMVLCFVDEKKLLNLKIDFLQCREKLYPIWKSQNTPWKVNLDHCSRCVYGSICPR